MGGGVMVREKKTIFFLRFCVEMSVFSQKFQRVM